MTNKFLKLFFFTTLILALSIGLLTWFDPTSTWLAKILVSIYNTSSEEISTVLITLFPIAVTFLCGIIALLICYTILAIKKNKEKKNEVNKKGFYTYYFFVLIGVSLLVLLFCVLKLNITERIIWTDDVAAFALIYAACILEAIVLSAFLVSFVTLWKTNKLSASIIGVIILAIVAGNFVSGMAVYDISSNDYSYNHYSSSYSSDYSDSPESVEIEVDTESTGSSHEIMEYEEDYLSFLWDENDSLDNTFTYLFQEGLSSWNSDYPHSFLSNIDSKLGWLTVNDESWREYLSDSEQKSEATLRKIYSYLKENPSELIKAFSSYKDVIYQNMPISEFYGKGAYYLLQYLTVAYQDLYSDDDYTRLQNIYKLMTNIEHDFAAEYYNDVKLHIDESYLPYFYDKDGDLHTGGVVWAYSFWARRHAEGTDDIAYTIISHLNEYYADSEYYYQYEEEEDYDGEEDYDQDEESY